MDEDMKTALINMGTNRQGTPVPPLTSTATADKLRVAGLIGPNNGSTRKGTIVRERLMDELMERNFS